MKKYIGAFLVSMAVFGVYHAYASSINDVSLSVYDGTSFVSVPLTPSGTVDSMLVFDHDDNVYRMAEMNTYFSIGSGQINFDLGQLVSNLTGTFATNGHSHVINDIASLQASLDGKASASSLSSLQTQVNSISTSTPVITNGVSKSIQTSSTATGTMLSSTKTSNVMYSVNIVTVATIGGSSAGEVLLEVSPTNTSTSTWTVINRVKNSQTISLAVALNSTQDITYSIMGNVPAGQYVRLRSNTISGTPTYSFVTGQEMQF